MQKLTRLIYYSRAASDGFAEVQSILRASIHNNRLDDITGLLVSHRGWFIQALEGPSAAVSATYARIYGDPRHRTPTISARATVAARLFPRWTMCAHALSDTDDAILNLIGGKAGFSPTTLTAASLERMLIAVSTVHDRVLSEQHQALSDEDEASLRARRA